MECSLLCFIENVLQRNQMNLRLITLSTSDDLLNMHNRTVVHYKHSRLYHTVHFVVNII